MLHLDQAIKAPSGLVRDRKGTAHDLDDAIVKAAPAMFRDLDGRPVRRTDDGPAAAPLA